MKSTREILEDAIIEAIGSKLEQKRNSSSGYLGLVGAYNGALDGADGLEAFRRRCRGQFPAVLVGAGESPYTAESVSRRRFRRDVQVDIFAASSNLRSREHRVRNDPGLDINSTRDPGVYKLLEHIHAIIGGNDLGLQGVGPATPIREDSLLRIDEFTIWRAIYEFKVDAHVEPWSAGDGQKLTAYYLKSQIAEEPADVAPNPLVESQGVIPE